MSCEWIGHSLVLPIWSCAKPKIVCSFISFRSSNIAEILCELEVCILDFLEMILDL
jgi:hypothetical protein